MSTAQTEARAIVEEYGKRPKTSILINLIATALAAKDAELVRSLEASEWLSGACRDAELRAERAEAGERAAHDASNTAIRQRDEARAQLAEVSKALDEIGNGCDGRVNKDALPCRIARRAREAQGGENG